ncbi:MAG: electron transfer flavoprotein subunit alpha/FixB family protein [Deltaproteobacteria bacterium]|nr:electron transfer flavoprotein subunit alpha/FixB family protein [Deltaproteobacteria bacterium]
MSNVLIVIEHAAGAPKKASLAAITFGQQAAQKTGGQVHLLVTGSGVGAVADKLKAYQVAKILVVDAPAFANHSTEALTAAIAAAQKSTGASIVAAASSSASKDVLPRVAARLGAAMASDVLAVIDASTFKRPMWAGNVVATVQLTTPTKVVTIRSTEFGAPAAGSGAAVEPLAVSVDLASFKAKFAGLKEVKSTRPELTSAARVVTGGRGVKGAEGFKLVEQLADALGAAVGASRAACDAGWVPNDLQVGQTGKIIAPDLYIGAGISGAIQHLAGMKGSKVIVAINKDPEAPIFQIADYGLVADLFKAIPELIDAIKKA